MKGGNLRMNRLQENKIAFIIARHSEENYRELLTSLYDLEIPPNYKIDVVDVIGSKNKASAYNKGMEQSDAKYKIYIDEKTSIVYSGFLIDMLKIFQLDKRVGLLGVVGTDRLPPNGIWLNSDHKIGKLLLSSEQKILGGETGQVYDLVMVVDGCIIATQYDLQWREDLFDKDCFFDVAQCIEFCRQGYEVAIARQVDPWVRYNSTEWQYDKESQKKFLVEYEKDIFSKIAAETKIKDYKTKIREFLSQEQYEQALMVIRYIGNMMYEYNQIYTDQELEDLLFEVGNELSMDKFQKFKYISNEKIILFYDGFGLDVRGLAQIYLKALDEIGYRILYITNNNAKGNIPTLKKILDKNKAEVIYLQNKSLVDDYYDICKLICKFKPTQGFLYTTPYDVSGILAFMSFEKNMKRYQINLTDHAFWLGTNAFDYCIEFRNYGATISSKYREIPANKIIKQPYYPIINKDISFGGYPFNAEKNDFIIFSGGWLYKTMDDDNTYYKIVEYCLEEFENTKFWYAGYGDATQLNNLCKRYPNRVFHTEERNDLFQILTHIDMYLNTYPLYGGLMMQYSSIAGRVPMSLRYNAIGDELLLNQANLGIEFNSIGELKKELYKFIIDDKYRECKEKKMKNTVISEKEFQDNLLNIIKFSKSKFDVNLYHVETNEIKRLYRRKFDARKW